MKPRRDLSVVPDPPAEPKLATVPELLNAAAAGKVLGISRSKIYELALAGELEGYRPGGRWRFTQAQLATYLESTKGGPRCPSVD